MRGEDETKRKETKMKSLTRDMWRVVTEGGLTEEWFDDFYAAVSRFTKLTQYDPGILEYHHKGRSKILFHVK